MKPIDVDELFDSEIIINETESDFNDKDKAEASVVAYLLQEDTSVNT